MIEVSPVGGLSFRIAAAMICITCIFYTTVMRTNVKQKLRSRLFNMLLIITLIGCITGIVSETIIDSDYSFRVRLVVSYIAKYLYYLTHMLLIPVFWIYVLIVCDVYPTISKKKLFLRLLPVIILELIVLSNPATHLVFNWDENLRYTRGPGIALAYIISMIYLFFNFYLLARYWKCMHAIQKVALFYFLGLAITGTLLQMVFPDIKCELMAEAIGFMGIMVMLEHEGSRNDYKTKAGNRTALIQDIKSCLLVKRDFHIICVRVVNAEAYRRITGYENYDLIMAKIADFLLSVEDKYEAYRTTGGNFFLMCPGATEEEVDRIIEKIADRFAHSFELSSGSTNVKAKILCAKCPEEFENVDDIILLSETDMDETDKVVYRGHDLDFLVRRLEVEKAIVRGMTENSFLVKYRPAYHKESTMIVSAEALLTLKDSVLGEIPFSEFIRVAERMNLVEELQNRMTESVIRFIQTGISRNSGEMDIRVLALHIMSVQALKPEYVTKVKELVDRYQVDPKFIVFDVSDTIVMQTQGLIENICEQFTEMGINFFLVNNEPGFLGLNPDILRWFTGIVINVQRHYSEVDEAQGDSILKNRCAMAKELGKSILLTGVDDRGVYERIQDMQADLVMGNYLSETVSKNELQTKFWHKETYAERVKN